MTRLCRPPVPVGQECRRARAGPTAASLRAHGYVVGGAARTLGLVPGLGRFLQVQQEARGP